MNSIPAQHIGTGNRPEPRSTPSAFEPLLDSVEAARLLRIHPKTLQRMARQGQIVGIHVGKLWRFRASDIEAWVNFKVAV
jgi:excisionase family DNA binding protein